MTETRVAGTTIAAALVTATAALAASSETPRLDAEVLLADVLGVERAHLVRDSKAPLEAEHIERLGCLVDRRRCGEPVAYLTGRRWFRALELAVDRRVLIPRSETEDLVELAVAELPPRSSVIDVGTGSGAIALALAAERPDLEVSGVDLSVDAIATAQANGERLNLDVRFRMGDLLTGVAPTDAVLANLPYVESGAQLPVDVAAFEPALALFGGADGLTVIRRLAAQLATRPWPVWVGLEIGETQGVAVAGLLRSAGFIAVEVRPDLSGRDRIVIGRRPRRQPAPR